MWESQSLFKTEQTWKDESCSNRSLSSYVTHALIV